MKEPIRRSRFTPIAVGNLRVIALAALLAAAGCVSTPTPQWPATPAQLYGELFYDVQLARVSPDDKTFVGAVRSATRATLLRAISASGASRRSI